MSLYCDFAFDPDRYLHSQLARAICLACYESPSTVEQISLASAVPALYIEDALPELIDGDALVKSGGSREPKYATDFIILRLSDRTRLERMLQPEIDRIAQYCRELLSRLADEPDVAELCRNHNRIDRLGWLIVPIALRSAIDSVMKRLDGFDEGEYPPRKDGGCGWFIVDQTADASECSSLYASGCNGASGDGFRILYHWVGKYFDRALYHGHGTKRLAALGLPGRSGLASVREGRLDEDTLARFVETGLIERVGNEFKLAFPIFTKAQFERLNSMITHDSDELQALLAELLPKLKREFESFTPNRLHSQINQRVSCFVGELIGMTCERLEAEGSLCENPHTEGICAVID